MTLKSLHIMEMVENKGVKSIGFFYGRSGMKCGSPNDNRIFTVIDLFAGCGGLSLGLYQAGWEGLFAIEKNAFAFETLKYNLIDNKPFFGESDWYEIKKDYTTGGKMRKLEVPRYTQIGNAIPPLFAELAGEVIFNYFERNRKYDNTMHRNLDAEYLEGLKWFLMKNLMEE